MTFAHPLALVGTVAVVALLLLVLRALERRRSADALTYSNLTFLEGAAASRIPWTALVAGAWAFAVACLGVALAGPHVTAPVAVRDGAVALCIDTSGSMSATDVQPTRADAALRAARAFIDAVPDGTRISIVAFSSNAAIVMPSSDDKDAVRAALDRVPPPNGGTAIGDALAVAARSLPPVRHRAIVLVTDGVNNQGSDPLVVAPQIGQSGTIIDTVGIGTSGSGLLIPGTEEEADLDETALRAVAQAANGAYARVGDADALAQHLSDLARTSTLERRRVDASFPLAIAGGTIMILATVGAFALGRFP
ncbi:MAG: VWA domain-containing protein [Candidatus Velthaea sp.]